MNIFVEIVTNLFRRFVQCFDRTYQRCFVVESLAGIGDEDCRDTEGVVYNKCGGGGVPGRITAGFERVAQSAVGEAGRIRFLLCEQFAAKFFNHTAVTVVFDKSVVFFGCPVGQGLEPVCIMGNSFFQCPHTHTGCHMVGYFAVDRCSVINGVGQGFVRFLGEILLHSLAVKYVLAIVLGYFLFGSDGFYGLTVGSFLHCIKA